jgi:hypothetical protein
VGSGFESREAYPLNCTNTEVEIEIAGVVTRNARVTIRP